MEENTQLHTNKYILKGENEIRGCISTTRSGCGLGKMNESGPIGRLHHRAVSSRAQRSPTGSYLFTNNQRTKRQRGNNLFQKQIHQTHTTPTNIPKRNSLISHPAWDYFTKGFIHPKSGIRNVVILGRAWPRSLCDANAEIRVLLKTICCKTCARVRWFALHRTI